MKLIFLTLVLLSAFVDLSAQTPCGDLTNQAGTLVKMPPQGKDAVLLKNINSVMTMLEKSVAGFRGGQTKIYLFDASNVNVPGGKPTAYTVAMYFLQYECVSGKPKLQAATDMWIYVGINQIPFFTPNNAVNDFKIANGQTLFYNRFKLGGEFKGFPKLSPLEHANGEAIYISAKNDLPFRTVSKGEVMPSYKIYLTAKSDETITRLQREIDREPKDLANIENDKYLTDKENLKRSLLEVNNKTRELLARFKRERAACIAKLDSFSANAAARQPAIVEFINDYCEPEKMFISADDSRARAITVFDEAFFDKTLPPAAPQFITVYWRREYDQRFPLKQRFLQQFLDNFDFAALKNMSAK